MSPQYLEYYNGKNILLTGGRGYIGSNLIKALKDVDCRILALDLPEIQPREYNSKAKVKDIVCDIRDPEIWDDHLKGMDIVFHLAAQTSVYVADQDPVKDLMINVLPLIQMLEACRINKWKPDILLSGTVTEVGMPEMIPVDESCNDNPITAYDLHKLTAENYLKFFSNSNLVRGVTLRLSNVYGPGPKSSNADRGVLNLMIQRGLAGEDLTMYGAGDYIRDYVFVDDVVEAFLIAGMKMDAVNGRHLIVGSGEGHTIREAFEMVADTVIAITGKKIKVVSVDPPDSLSLIELRNFIADINLIYETIGWRPEVLLDDGIRRTAEFYIE